ncbi:MAG: acyltransferase family protein [Opitutaceae bacterium]
MFHMPLFMAISGYVSFRGFQRDSVAVFLRRRASQLLLPIVAWAIVRSVVWDGYLVLTGSGLSVGQLGWVILREICSSYWFLWALFASSGLLFLSFAIPIRRDVSMLIACCVAFVLPDIGNIPLFKYTLPFFCLGYWTAAKGDWRETVGKWPRIALVLLGVAAAICFIFWDPLVYVYVTKTIFSTSNIWRIALRYVSGLIVSLWIVGMSSRLLRDRHGQLLSALGQRSLSIYILQASFFSLFEGFWNPLRGSILFSLFFAPIIAGCITFLCWYTALLIQRIPILAEVFLGQNPRVNR